MTPKAFRILRKLRRSQLSPGSLVFVNFDDMYFSPVVSDDVVSGTEFGKRRVRFREPYDSLQEIFQYLSDKGYIRRDGHDWSYITVTHAGNNIGFEYLSAFVSFLFRSVLIPVIVAILTTVALHIIEGWL